MAGEEERSAIDLKGYIEAGESPSSAMAKVFASRQHLAWTDKAAQSLFEAAQNNDARGAQFIDAFYRRHYKGGATPMAQAPGQASTQPPSMLQGSAEPLISGLRTGATVAGIALPMVAGGAVAPYMPASILGRQIPDAVRLAMSQGLLSEIPLALEQALARISGQQGPTAGEAVQSGLATTFTPPIVEAATRIALPGGPGTRKALAGAIGAVGNVLGAAAQPGPLSGGSAAAAAGLGALGGAWGRAIQENMPTPNPSIFAMLKKMGFDDTEATIGARMGDDENLQALLNAAHTSGTASTAAKEAAAAFRNRLQGVVGLAIDPTDVSAPENLTVIKKALGKINEDARSVQAFLTQDLLQQAGANPQAVGSEKYNWAFQQIQDAIAANDQAAVDRTLRMLGRGQDAAMIESFFTRAYQNLRQLRERVSTPFDALSARPEMQAELPEETAKKIREAIIKERQFLAGDISADQLTPDLKPHVETLDNMLAEYSLPYAPMPIADLPMGKGMPPGIKPNFQRPPVPTFSRMFAQEKRLRALRDMARQSGNMTALRTHQSIREAILDAIEEHSAPEVRDINAAYRAAHTDIIDPLQSQLELGMRAGGAAGAETAAKRMADPTTVEGKSIRQLVLTADQDTAAIKQAMGASAVNPDLAGARRALRTATPGARAIGEQNLIEAENAALRADKPSTLVRALLPDVEPGFAGSADLERAKRSWQGIAQLENASVRESVIAGTIEDALARFKTPAQINRAIQNAQQVAGFNHPVTKALELRLRMMNKASSPLDTAMAIQAITEAGGGAGTLSKLFKMLDDYDPGSPEVWRIIMSNMSPEAAETFRQGLSGSLLVGDKGPSLDTFVERFGKLRPQIEAILGDAKARKLEAMYEYLTANDGAALKTLKQILNSVDPTFISQARGLAAFAGALRLGMGINLPILPTMLATHLYPIAVVDQIINGPGPDSWGRALTRVAPNVLARPKIKAAEQTGPTEYGRPGAVR